MRPWHIAQAMKSVRSLDEIIDELTEEELLHILELESGSLRRPSVVKRVFKKAVELNRQNYLAKLKEKFPWLATNP